MAFFLLKAALALKILENQSKMLSAILIGNNLVNTSAASIASLIAYSFGGAAVRGRAVRRGLRIVLLRIGQPVFAVRVLCDGVHRIRRTRNAGGYRRHCPVINSGV